MNNQIPEVFLPVKDYIVHLEDFDLIKIIGKGSYGEVYYAIHKTTGTKAALKKLLFDELDEVQLEYFIREVLILAYYNNFFLVSFLGFSPTYPYLIITEYVPCGSLFDAIHHKPGAPLLSGTDKTKIAIGIIEGMIILHSNKVIHRDLKSLNILLDEHYLPKICDFGISRAIDEDNQSKMTVRIGTFHWMAPEMLDSDDYSYKVDVYAFAIMLWEMITEKVPYQGQDPLKILINVRNNGMRPEIPRDCNDGLLKLMVRCWDQDPDVRPSFAELYKIFRNEDIHFNNTNIEEVHQFFEQFPISDDILHDKTETDINKITNEIKSDENKILATDTNKEEMNNELDTNDINNDINDDVNVLQAPQIIENVQKNVDIDTGEKDSSYSEEESLKSNESEQQSDCCLTQQRNRQSSLVDHGFQRVNSMKIFDNSNRQSLKDKKKEKKKEKSNKKDEKMKNKIEKEKKKEEKKKRKIDSEELQLHQLKQRRLSSSTNFSKQLKNDYPIMRQNVNSNRKPPIILNKPNNTKQTFDKLYDIEIAEIKKRRIPINENKASNLNKVTITHNRLQLNENIFSKYFSFIDVYEQRTPYIISFCDFEESKDQIYTSNKDNIFFDPDYFTAVNTNTSADTECFIIDDNAYTNFVKPQTNSKRVSKISSSSMSVDFLENEEEEDNQDDNVEDMLRQSSGRGKLINIFKAELEEITIDNSVEVFNDLKNLIEVHRKRNEDKIKDDVYIFLLARSFKNKMELILSFNNINGFEMLPISGNSLITPAFITLFSVCILHDLKRFPFKVFNEVFEADSYQNTQKFLHLLHALNTSIQNNIFNDIKNKEKLTEVSTLLLKHFFDNKEHFNRYNAFPQILFSIYSKLLKLRNVFDEKFLYTFRLQLIDISNNIITYSTELETIKTAYSIHLSNLIDSIPLFESQEKKQYQFPLRQIAQHISSIHSNQPICGLLEKGELTFQSVSFFARFNKPPISSTLITRLVENVLWNTQIVAEEDSETAKMACLILCRIAKTRKGSELLCEKSPLWMEAVVKDADHVTNSLNIIKEAAKNKSESVDINEELGKELIHASKFAERAEWSFRILLTIFISHIGLIEKYATQSYFWKFIEACIRVSNIHSLYCYNASNVGTADCFSSLVAVLKSSYSLIRRVQAKLVSPSLVNDSKLLYTLCHKVLTHKTSEKSIEAVELGLQLFDIIVRATACSKAEGMNGSSLFFVDDFVSRIPSLLSANGVIAHKAIIASVSLFILHPNEAQEALKNAPQLRSNKSNLELGSKLAEDSEIASNKKSSSLMIKDALLKVSIVSGFEGYKKSLLDILAKNGE